jgi:plastocyanin/PKD repeat protein
LSDLTASTGTSVTHTVEVRDFEFFPQHITIATGDLVQWDWTGVIEHTTTSDATDGPDSWDSGLFGQGATYVSPTLSSGVHPYYCIPHGGPGGVGMSGTITVQASCTDGAVPVALSFGESGGSFDGYEVLVDGQIIGTFAYDASGMNNISVNVIGDGQSHTILVRDLGDTNCSVSTNIVTPDCNASTCSLGLSAVESGPCDGSDQVSVELTVTDVGGGASGFTASVDGQSVGTFAYSGNGTTVVSVNIAGDGQNHTITVTDIEDGTCSASADISTSNCTLPCSLDNLTLNVAGGGNPITHIVEVRDFEFFPANIDINLGDIVRFEWTGVIEHTTTSDATDGPDSWDSGLFGQGAVYEVTPITEGVHPYYCIPHGGPGGVGMSGVINVLPANPCQGETVSLNISFESTNPGNAGYNLFVDGQLTANSPISYDPSGNQSLIIDLVGDGLSHSVEVQDIELNTCSASSNIIVPDCSVSAPCSLELSILSISDCDENNNLSVTFEVQSEQTSGVGFNVLVDGNQVNTNPIAYDVSGITAHTINFAGTGADRLIEIVDVDSVTCQASQTISTSLCGPVCEILDLNIETGMPSLHYIEVRDFDFFPPQITTKTGDTVAFIWTGTIEHTSTSDALDGPSSWDSGLLGQGSEYRIVLEEAGTHPFYCIPHGGPGGIGMSGTINVVEDCDDGFTLADISFAVTNGSTFGYNVFLDGEFLSGPFVYNDPVGQNSISVSIPGDGMQHTLTVQDIDVEFCALSSVFTAPECPVLCEISNLTATSGNAVVHQVEVRNNEFVPEVLNVYTSERINFIWTDSGSHSTTSDNISGANSWDSGILEQGSEFEIQLNQAGDHPYFCQVHGGPGGVGMSGLIHASQTCEDSIVGVQISFEVQGGAATGYNVLVDGELLSGSPFAYDDTMGMNEQTLMLIGDGATHFITIQDTGDEACVSSTQIALPDCEATCAISLTNVEYDVPVLHTVEVLDFEFSPRDIIVNVGDTIRFEWTGVIAHTVTSDAQTGSDVFNSGLLDQGAVWELVIETLGMHPYYCIPHGAPGGIGMAGTIQVVESCEDGQLNSLIQFTADSPGFNGYQVFVDGEGALGNPYSYATGLVQSLVLDLPADGQEHQILIQDLDNEACLLDTILIIPDCSDECFGFEADFSYELDPNTQTVTFTDQSSANTESWLWTFGDGEMSTLQNPVYQYETFATYEVCLIASSANMICADTICKNISIEEIFCAVAFSYETEGLTVLLTDESIISDTSVNVSWYLEDGTALGEGAMLSYSFEDIGVYTICMEVNSENCSEVVCQTIDLSDPCLLLTANFSYTADSENPKLIQFTDLTQGAHDQWLWGFGDGFTSNEANPSYEYASTGIYTVCLLAQNTANACTDAYCDQVYVGVTDINNLAEEQPLFIYPNPSYEDYPTWHIQGIKSEDYIEDLSVRVFDMRGSIIEEEIIRGEEAIAVSIHRPLAAGMYFIELRSKHNIYRGRVVQQ